MGSSKKHKEKDREGKKKRKHRSRSRSHSKERKRKRRDRSRSPVEVRERIPANEEEFLYGKNDDPTYEEQLHREKQRTKYAQEHSRHRQTIEQDEERPERGAAADNKEAPSSASGDGSSLSIEETNRLRAKLGLKPLEQKGAVEEDGKPKKTEGVHAPPVNMAQQKKTERLKEKMANKKTTRHINSKLGKIKGLGESDSDDEGAKAWVLKSRKLQKDRILAEKRAKMLEEMDQDFGIGNLVEEEFHKGKGSKKAYGARDLSGLTVEHGLDKFEEGRRVILTIKDKGILDEDEEGDVLVNVNIEDDERAEKNVDNKKKKPDYKPYDDGAFDEYGMLKPNNMLEKYDEEIDGVKRESFKLGSSGSYDASQEKRMAEIRHQLKAQGESLMIKPRLVTEYMTTEEDKTTTFNKTKKKVRKIRKKEKSLKADDLKPLPEEITVEDYGSRSRGKGRQEMREEGEVDETIMDVDEPAFSTDMARPPPLPNMAPPLPPPLPTDDIKAEFEDSDIIGPDEDLTGVALEEEKAQNELQGVLARARRLKLKKEKKNHSLEHMMVKTESEADEEKGINIVLNSTSEFCRNLGEIPTYGLSGNREEDRDELLDMELELLEQKRKEAEMEEATGGWNEVDIDENPVDIKIEEASILEEEPIVTDGIGAALRLAAKKGFLEDNEKKVAGLSKPYLELQAQNYSIQDKNYNDLDEKNRKRDRYSGGMISEFREKTHYKPEVTLDYVDEGGRSLSAKEAFRQLSHRFHGKGSGKKKTEKRGKKVEEELLMKRMSSTDTPLNTLSLLQDKQRSEQSPYVILSGNKGFTSNSITKQS